MGCVQQAVLEFDEEVRAPWRPRLVSAPAVAGDEAPVRSLSRHSPSRVGACQPPASPGRPAHAAGPARTARPPADGSTVARGARSVTRPPRAPRPASDPASSGLRLTRRARRLVMMLAVAVAMATGSWLGLLVGGEGGGDLLLAGESSVVVQSGDTLWSIATALDGEGDVRARIDEIQRLNGLESADLVPGQVLQLP
jgi:nucleoid-associated protein YgaU